jgi:hypothetical protein
MALRSDRGEFVVLRASRVDCVYPLLASSHQYPGGSARCFVARFPISRRPSSCFNRLGFHIARFEACSVFILLRGCLLADPACRTSDLSGFVPVPLPARHAPTASGWSNSCRVGYLPPTGSTRPFHGALKPWAVLYSCSRQSPTAAFHPTFEDEDDDEYEHQACGEDRATFVHLSGNRR